MLFCVKDADSEVKINDFHSAEAWGETSSSLSFLITINVKGTKKWKLKNKLHNIMDYYIKWIGDHFITLLRIDNPQNQEKKTYV